VGEGRLPDDESRSNRRLTVPQAAAALGITEGAVRGRVKRGTLSSVREGGTVYVILGGGQTSSSRDKPSGPPPDQSELVTVLREQLAAERQAHAEARRIIAGLVERLPPAIEAPQDTTEAPQDAEEQQGRDSPQTTAPGAQEGARRPWWRRVFGQ
jgi:hypothetical protein